MSVPIQTVKR